MVFNIYILYILNIIAIIYILFRVLIDYYKAYLIYFTPKC